MEGKKKYVKPEMRVAEWDFNEAVCDNSVMLLSTCNVTSEVGKSEIKINTFRGEIDWEDFNETTQKGRGF